MGRTLWLQRKPPATQQALVHYDRAIALAPDYALAWSGIADARGASPINGDADPRVVKPAVRRAVMEALRAEPELAEVQTSQGVLNFWLEWNWPEAEHALRHALALDPEYPFAHQVLANVLSHSGRHREALDEMRKARELDPLDPILFAISSQVAFHAKDYARATEHARDALRIDPDRAYAAGAGAG